MRIIRIAHDSQNSLTLVEIKGELQHHDILPVFQDCYQEGVSKYFIWDFTQADLNEITANELRKLAEVAGRFSLPEDKGRTALVMDKRVNFGIGRMFEVYAESVGVDLDIQTFYDMEEAHSWLGLDPSKFHFEEGQIFRNED